MKEQLWQVIERGDFSLLESLIPFRDDSECLESLVSRKRNVSGPYPLEAIVLYAQRTLRKSENKAETCGLWNDILNTYYSHTVDVLKSQQVSDQLRQMWEEGEQAAFEQCARQIHALLPLFQTLLELNKKYVLHTHNHRIQSAIPLLAQSVDSHALASLIEHCRPVEQENLDIALLKLFSDPRKVSELDDLKKCFTVLLKEGGCIQSSSQGDHVLLKAVRQGHNYGVELLLQESAQDPDAFSIHVVHQKTGNNCIHEACESRNPVLLERLLNAKADPNVCNLEGNTPMHVLLLTNAGKFSCVPDEPEKSLAILSLLQRNHVRLNILNNNGDNPLHISSATPTQTEWILQQVTKAQLEQRNNKGQTPIDSAIVQGNIERVVKLLEAYKKFDVVVDLKDTKDNLGNDLLHLAARSEEYGYLTSDFIQHAGCQVDSQNDSGDSALHVAMRCDNVEAVEQLLDAGAILTCQNHENQTPVDVALQCMSIGSIYQILKRSPDSIEDAQLASIRHKSGCYLVHRAIEVGHWHLVNLLIDRGIDITIPTVSEDGFEDDGNVLHFAARSGNQYLLDLLLGVRSIDVNSRQNFRKNTALHIACNMDSVECVKLLVRHPLISLDLVNGEGQSALDCAYESCANECATVIQVAKKEKALLQQWRAEENLSRVLIIGGGFVGSRLALLFSQFGYTVFETHRTVNSDLKKNTKTTRVQFELENKETWNNLPKEIDLCIITMAMKFPLLVEEFYDVFISKEVTKVLLFGSTSRYVSTELHGKIGEECQIDESQTRVQCEEILRKKGAMALVLAGIYGAERQPKKWFMQGRIKNPNKYLNMIHVYDILSSTIWTIQQFSTLLGTNINISDGNPKWMEDLFHFYGFTVPNNKEEIPSKRIQNAKLKSFLPKEFEFCDLLR